ncbi:hypothetical protein BJF90_01715 [Pseudonocardia sp. CNS-004]|nr:hypothetical protein BJF90_01715 [Pseudonocardia sp. CNS-004]
MEASRGPRTATIRRWPASSRVRVASAIASGSFVTTEGTARSGRVRLTSTAAPNPVRSSVVSVLRTAGATSSPLGR